MAYFFPVLLSFVLSAIATLTNCTSPEINAQTYDYIVTGSGPGGGTLAVNLALANHSVLLIEAGNDASSDLSTVIHSLGHFGSAESTWNFYVKHGDDEERAKRHNLMVWRLTNGELWVGRDPAIEGHIGAQRMGIYYPRGATLGGSAVVNAAVAVLPSDSDWDFFEKGNGNSTGIWSGKEMRRIFQKIEKNNYLPTGTSGHGFNGWLQINAPNDYAFSPESLILKLYKSVVKLIGGDPAKVIDYAISDPNGDEAGRDHTEGLFALPFHVSKVWQRFSPRERILATRNATTVNGARKHALDLQLNSLTTKVLFDTCGGKPKAVGVEWLEGTAVYRGDPRFNSTTGKVGRAFARKEVIVSGGAFNSPQILQLSGIGPKALLQKYNIPIIVDLPGVGRNLQDNYELPIIGHAETPAIDPIDPNAPRCGFGAPGDPCVELWKNGTGPYSHGSNTQVAFMLKTNHSLDGEKDVLMFTTGGGNAFRGFKPQTKQNFSEPLKTLAWSTVKMHPQNTKGYIQIRSADPQDTPEVNFQHFAEGSETDVGAFLDTLAFARKSFSGTEAPVGPVKPVEPPCPAADIKEDGYCKDSTPDAEWYKDQVFGHHPTSSCSVGSDDNPLAVLDTRLRVRGVERLRVVDASAFPRVPGAFPAVATFMLGEKASELVLKDAPTL